MTDDLSRLSDGTYGRELGRISPEGNLYGTTRWVRDVLRNFWWNGTKWLEIGEDIGQSASVDLLPTSTQEPDTVWRCLHRQEEGRYIWKYFFWDVVTQTWAPIEWYHTVDSVQELPSSPYRRGQAHEVKEADVQVMWDGFTWRRLRVSSFDDDIGLSSGVNDLTNTTHQLQEDHNGLLESFFGFQETVNYAFLYYDQEVEDLDEAIGDLQGDWDDAISGRMLTAIEAHSLNLMWIQVSGEAEDIIDLAEALETELTLDLTTAKNDYASALSQLEIQINRWINLAEYPVEILETDRELLATAIQNEAQKRATLISILTNQKIETTKVEIDEEIGEVNSALGDVETKLNNTLSDGYITKDEAKSLQLAFARLDSECSDILDIGVLLELTLQATNLDNALVALEAKIVFWASLEAYPSEITPQQRTDIVTAFSLVETYIVALNTAITNKLDADSYNAAAGYIDGQLEDVDERIGVVEQDIADFSSDLKLTSAEAHALNISYVQLQGEVEDIIDAAELIGEDVDTERLALETAMSTLTSTLSVWIGQASYPLDITANQRQSILDALDAVERAKTVLVDKISQWRSDNVDAKLTGFQGQVTEEFSEYDERVGFLETGFDEISSDGYVTLIEAQTLGLALVRVQSEAADIVDLAEAIALPPVYLTTAKTNYEDALASLVTLLSTWIGKETYPIIITEEQRTSIKTQFQSVESTKVALNDAITRALDDKIVVNVQDQIDDINEAAEDLSELVEDSLSDSYVSSIEAQSLRTSLHALQSEANDVIVLATATGIAGLISLADALDSALDALVLALALFIDGETAYPRSVTAQQREDINDAFADVQSKKTALVDALAQAKADGAYNDASFDLSEFRIIYNGFVRGFTPEFELAYISENELSLRPRYSDYDYLTISEQNIQASKRTSVFTFSPVLNWNSETEALYYSTLQPSTEYWVYLANRSAGFALNVYDFRGRLFCSDTEPVNNYLGSAGLGLNAILIGKCKTNASIKFLYELDVSLVSRNSDMKETFREFSDFELYYTNEETLTLDRIYGTYGQIYIPESLYYIGENRVLTNTDNRILYDTETGLLALDDSDISSSKLYYVYIAGDTDIYNFNEINPATSLPWHPEDTGAGDGLTGPYYTAKDLRLRMFLCDKEPEEGRLAETWRGFWARHIGQTQTEGNGKFVYSPNVSAIRQATLNPAHFEGLAEAGLQINNDGTIRLYKKTGTSGIVMVAGRAVDVYELGDSRVHSVTPSSAIYNFNPALTSDNFTDSGDSLTLYCNARVYLYLTNNIPAWGSLANTLILSDSAPFTHGYIDSNFPGNNARWIATLKPKTASLSEELVTNPNFDGTTGWLNLDIPVNNPTYEGEDGDDNTSTDYSTLEASSDTTPTPQVISASSVYSSTWAAWKAFDQDTSSAWICNVNATPSSGSPISIMVDYGEGNEVVINKYTFIGRPTEDERPAAWKLQGSNNTSVTVESDSNWIDLDEQTGQTSPGVSSWNSYYTFINHTAYRYYRMRITAKISSTYNHVSLGELKLVAADITVVDHWSGMDDWSLDEDNNLAFHNTGSVLPLEQEESEISANTAYQLDLTLSDRTAGSVTVSVGGANTEAISINGDIGRLLTSVSDDVVKLTPTSDYDGKVSSVNVREVLAGTFNKISLEDSIFSKTVEIDDSNASAVTTFSGSKIIQLISEAVASMSATTLYTSQQSQGLPLEILRNTATSILIRPTSGSATIVFPDMSTRTIPESGITASVDGIGNCKYVWLGKTNVTISTDAPTQAYSNLYVKDNRLLVGYLYNDGQNDGTDYATPIMASNENALCKVSGANDTNWPYRAFNRENVDFWQVLFYSDSVAYGAYLVIEFKDGPKTINKYAFQARSGYNNYTITHWWLAGSNNSDSHTSSLVYYRSLEVPHYRDNDFTILDYRQPTWSKGGDGWSQYFYFPNSTPYRFYKLYAYFGNGTWLGDFKLVDMGSDSKKSIYSRLALPLSLFSTGADGANNPAIVSATPRATFWNAPSPYRFYASSEHSFYYAYRAFSQTQYFSYGYTYYFNSWIAVWSSPPISLMVDMGSPICINKYALFPDLGYSTDYHPKTWKLQGSNNTSVTVESDSNWIDLDEQTDQSKPGYFKWSDYYTFSNSTSYRYYRLRISHVNGAGDYVAINELRLIENKNTV